MQSKNEKDTYLVEKMYTILKAIAMVKDANKLERKFDVLFSCMLSKVKKGGI